MSYLRLCRFTCVCILLALASSSFCAQRSRRNPNILFIIMDDVGIDQIRAFNPSIATIPTPNIEAIAQQGRIKFQRVPSNRMFLVSKRV